MINLVQNPGFEEPNSWNYFHGALRAQGSLYAYSGNFGGLIIADPSVGPAPYIEQTALEFAVGAAHSIALAVKTYSVGWEDLVVKIDRGDGNLVECARRSGPVAFWTIWDAGSFIALGPTGQIQIISEATRNYWGWHVDDVVCGDLMAVSKWAAVQAIKTMLLGINGGAGGYYFDVGSRVHTMLHIPGEGDAVIDMPYFCIELSDERPEIEQGPRHVKIKWHPRIHGFVKESAASDLESLGLENVCKLHDDVWRAVTADITLGGAVRDTSIVDFHCAAGVLPDEMPYGELILDLELYQQFQRSDLGPSA